MRCPEQERLLSTFVTKPRPDRGGLLVSKATAGEILRATEKLQSALLNSISHDLRTPLSSILRPHTLRLEDDYIDGETRR